MPDSVTSLAQSISRIDFRDKAPCEIIQTMRKELGSKSLRETLYLCEALAFARAGRYDDADAAWQELSGFEFTKCGALLAEISIGDKERVDKIIDITTMRIASMNSGLLGELSLTPSEGENVYIQVDIGTMCTLLKCGIKNTIQNDTLVDLSTDEVIHALSNIHEILLQFKTDCTDTKHQESLILDALFEIGVLGDFIDATNNTDDTWDDLREDAFWGIRDIVEKLLLKDPIPPQCLPNIAGGLLHVLPLLSEFTISYQDFFTSVVERIDQELISSHNNPILGSSISSPIRRRDAAYLLGLILPITSNLSSYNKSADPLTFVDLIQTGLDEVTSLSIHRDEVYYSSGVVAGNKYAPLLTPYHQNIVIELACKLKTNPSLLEQSSTLALLTLYGDPDSIHEAYLSVMNLLQEQIDHGVLSPQEYQSDGSIANILNTVKILESCGYSDEYAKPLITKCRQYIEKSSKITSSHLNAVDHEVTECLKKLEINFIQTAAECGFVKDAALIFTRSIEADRRSAGTETRINRLIQAFVEGLSAAQTENI